MNLNRQNGNVLFLILIAVALFAALSYAITSSSRNSGGDTKSENVQLLASQMLQYTSSLRVAAQRMVMSGISPELLEVHGTNTWDPCSSGTKYCLFGPKGGGAIAGSLKADDDLYIYGNVYNYNGVNDNQSILGAGTSAPDIYVILSFKFNEKGRQLCEAINKAVGIAGIPVTDNTNGSLGNLPAAPGQLVACTQHYTTNYYFYHSLYER